jgi:hypothetical protein
MTNIYKYIYIYNYIVELVRYNILKARRSWRRVKFNIRFTGKEGFNRDKETDIE